MDKSFAIFDMDGTLTDSMHFWVDLGAEYLRAKGKEPDERMLWMVQTMTMEQTAQHFMDTFGVSGPPERIIGEMEELMAVHYRSDVPLKPGVAAYLDELGRRGVRMYVATATAVPLATACLERLEVLGRFEGLLSCESLGVSKTRPDIYLEAARRMGAAPADCAVYEDALYAARTAKAAGFYTVGVYEPSLAHGWDELTTLADEIITDWRNAL